METWTATAKLRWLAGGKKVGEECFAFTVKCPALPQDDPSSPGWRREVTLKLVCADARERYGVPPRTVDVQLDEEDRLAGFLYRACWRMGDFRYGMGIVSVGPPPPKACLLNVTEMKGEADAS